MREDAEEAARIALRHGIKELPELREVDLGGKETIPWLDSCKFPPCYMRGSTQYHQCE
uniref:Uncharacterized protein n=1 Tax=Myoviridae sp. ct0Tg8 TaxID=2826598 RepID=A0A8S5NCF2_9CAUD|nr:MAG TPA: hypothetical protein [Myoviridae sp. ct0Tg8]